MKRRWGTAWLATVMSLALLAGCGQIRETGELAAEEETGSEQETIEKVEEVSEETKELAEIKAAVFYFTYEDIYISSVRTALNELLDELGVTYWNFDGNNDQTTQNEQIDVALSQGADILIVNIVTPDTPEISREIVHKAKEADIPVIFFNRSVEKAEEEGAVLTSYEKSVFVGTNAPQAGHIQGKMIGEYLVKNYSATDLNGDGIIQYAMLMGEEDNTEAIARTRYSVEDANELLINAGKPELEYFDALRSDKYQADSKGAWSEAAGYTYMVDNLIQFNEANGNMIELIICNNDEMARGAIKALNETGYNLGKDESITIPIFGVDAVEAAVSLIREGKMTGTVKQDAGAMAEAVAQLVANTAREEDLMANLEDFTVDTEKGNKISVLYEAYTGK